MGLLGISKGVLASSQVIPPATPSINMPFDTSLTQYITNDSSTATITNSGGTALTLSGAQTINGVSVAGTLQQSGAAVSWTKVVWPSFTVPANTNFTLSFWFKPNSTANTYDLLVSGDATNASSNEISLYTISGARIRFYNGSSYADTTTGLLSGWYFILINRNLAGNSLRLYINGSLQATITQSASGSVFPDGIMTFADGTNCWSNGNAEYYPCNISDFYFINGVSEDGTVIKNPLRKNG